VQGRWSDFQARLRRRAKRNELGLMSSKILPAVDTLRQRKQQIFTVIWKRQEVQPCIQSAAPCFPNDYHPGRFATLHMSAFCLVQQQIQPKCACRSHGLLLEHLHLGWRKPPYWTMLNQMLQKELLLLQLVHAVHSFTFT